MGKNIIIGREYEQHILEQICKDTQARLVAVYGRRRVGKTYLIKQFFQEQFDFYFTGSFEMSSQLQLALFAKALMKHSGVPCSIPKNWFEAFEQLQAYLEQSGKQQLIVFLDELPWMETPKSNFLKAFSYFWNSWASTRNGLKLIVCGSATTWMLDKIIGDKGGLYGRVSRAIYLAPFNLHEVEQFLLQCKGIVWSRYQILEAYMIMGGIPYYLDMLDKDVPFVQNIDNLFFHNGAPLRAEYGFLYRSLFKSSTIYYQIVEVIAKKIKGVTLKEIKEAVPGLDGGTLSTALNNLCKCDFVRRYSAFGKKERDSIYQLTDLFSLYYLRFIKNRSGQDEHLWSNIQESKRNAWAGYAFEQVCLHHIEQIRSKLSIKGVLTDICTWSSPRQIDKDGTEWPGTQIDLLLSRGDHIIDICEMKYSKDLYNITGDYSQHLRERAATFVHFTKTKAAIHTILVTTFGLKPNKYSGDIYTTVTAEDLFKD